MTSNYEEAVDKAQTLVRGTSGHILVHSSLLRSLLSGPPEREGWVSVPRDPTPAMFQAVYDQHCSKLDDMWTAMLSAAPKP